MVAIDDHNLRFAIGVLGMINIARFIAGKFTIKSQASVEVEEVVSSTMR